MVYVTYLYSFCYVIYFQETDYNEKIKKCCNYTKFRFRE